MLSKHFSVLRMLALSALLNGAATGNLLAAVSTPPLELSQLKAYLANHPLQAATRLVKERGIRFVPTQKIKKEIEASIPSSPKDAADYLEQLNIFWEALDQHQPKELVIAIAPFCGGVPDQLQNIQVAMERKLHSLGTIQTPFRIFSTKLDKRLPTDGEADKVGQELGVHIVVWGEWIRNRGVDTFIPRIRLTQPFRGSEAFKDAVRQYSFTYRLEPTQPLRPEVAPAPLAASSDLIPLLIGLSFYHEADYQRAAQVLGSVTSPSSDVYMYLAICSLALNDLQTARQYLANAEKTGQASLEALHDVGTLEAQVGNLDEALKYFDKALQVDSHSFKTLNNKAIVLAMKAAKKSEDEKAEQKNEESCSKDSIETIKQSRESGGPSYLTAVYNHAAILLNCAKYTSTALEGVQILRGEYLTRNPDDHEAWSACGTVYRVELNKYKEAEDCFLEAVRHKPSSEEYWGYLVNVLRVDPNCWRYEGRATFFSTLVALQPRAPLTKQDRLWRQETVLSGLALAMAVNGRFREAREAFSKLPVRFDDLEECEQRLVYELAVGRIPLGRESNVEFMSSYLPTVYQHFFLVREVGELEFRPNLLFHEYEELLLRAPSNIPARLGKALLEYKLVFGESSVTKDRKSSVERELLEALKEAVGVTTSQSVRSHLRDCIREVAS